MLRNLRQDIRYGLRGMRKRPGFTAVFAPALVFGVGAGAATLSPAHAVLLRPLPLGPSPTCLRSAACFQ